MKKEGEKRKKKGKGPRSQSLGGKTVGTHGALENSKVSRKIMGCCHCAGPVATNDRVREENTYRERARGICLFDAYPRKRGGILLFRSSLY